MRAFITPQTNGQLYVPQYMAAGMIGQIDWQEGVSVQANGRRSYSTHVPQYMAPGMIGARQEEVRVHKQGNGQETYSTRPNASTNQERATRNRAPLTIVQRKTNLITYLKGRMNALKLYRRNHPLKLVYFILLFLQ